MKTRHLISAAILGLGLLPQLLWAVQCKSGLNLTASNPDSIYVINSNGTVTDSRTSLMWKRCSEGQAWDGVQNTCTGNATTLTWASALAAGVTSNYANHTDWRLPNIKELTSVVEFCTDSPAINPVPFPGFPVRSGYWSSSPTKNAATAQYLKTNLAWSLEILTGAYDQIDRGFFQNVLLVRNFQALAQTIGPVTFTPASLVVGTSSTLSATASSGQPVSFISATLGTCSVAGNVTSGYSVSGLAAGTCTVTATQSGNGSYAAASPVQGSVTVGKGSQTIGTITFTSTFLAVEGTTTVNATASSGLAVSFSSSVTPAICSVSGNTVTGLATGTCTVTASQTGTADYLAATPVTQNIAVKASQIIGAISFSPTSLSAGVTTTASAAGGASGNPVTFGSTSLASICTVSSSGLVTGVGVGTCVVIANQAGNGSYADALAVTATITVNQGSQTIGPISFTPASLVVGGTSTLNASATSGLAVSFSSSPQSICTVVNGIVTGKGVGTCTIVANQGGNVNYAEADPRPVNITVGKGSQVISGITFSLTTLAIGGTTTVSATSSSGLPVSFNSSATPTICSVSGNTVTGSLAGTCTITASQNGDSNYLVATPVTGDVSVKLGQTIGPISFTPATLAVGGATTASAAPGASGNTVTFSTTSLASICTVTTVGLVTGVSVGSCVVAANQAGSNIYAAAPQKTGSITVGQGSQTIGAITLLGSLSVGSTSTAQATASSGLPVSFGSSTPNTCTVTSVGTVYGVSAGPCTITADQAGDGTNYAAASRLSQGFTVLLNQTISAFAFTPNALVVGGMTTASASGGGSANPVSFDSASPATCDVINGNTVRGLTVGTCTITANQPGDGTIYAAANPAAKNITVGLGSQTIGAITFTPTTLNFGATAVASASATSGFPVSFSASVTPTICSVSGTNGAVIAGDNIGTCTITASQDGFQGGIQYYNAAPSVQKNILVTGTTVSFNPDALTFDPQYVGTSATKTLTLTNTGAGRLKITSILPTVNVFAVSGNTCLSNGGNVLAGASCTISVTFSPAVTGTRVGSIRVTSNSANTTDSFTVSGQGVASNAPICTLSASPTSVLRGRSSMLTPNCSPTPTSYSWTGGTCDGTSAATCTVTPTLTTAYGVTGTNSFGSSTGSATVTVKPVDLTPILMLLLD